MKNLFKDTRKLTFLGLMLGITVILDVTPLGAVPLGPISATTTHIPAIVTGVILGPAAGFISGTFLGLVSMLHALLRPVAVLDPLFINPLLSVLPRMFIGVVSYYMFSFTGKLLKNTGVRQAAGAFIGGIAGSLTNTGLVFLMLYLLYAQIVAEKLGTAFKVILITVLTTNAIAEALIAGFLTLAIASAYLRYKKSQKQ